MLSALAELASLLVKRNNTDMDIDDVKDTFNKAKSIAEKAKKGMSMYPVIISYTFAAIHDVALRIVKNLELYYAYFTMVTAGLNPVLGKNGSISSKLADFAGENAIEVLGSLGLAYEHAVDIDGKPLDVNVHLIIGEDQTMCEGINLLESEKVDESVLEGFLQIVQENMKDYKHSVSTEAVHSTIAQNGGFETKERNEHYHGGTSEKLIDAISVEQFKKFLSGAAPTIVSLTYHIGNNNKVNIAVGIKAVPHFATVENMTSLLDNSLRDVPAKAYHRWIQFKTGEIKLFRDLIFQYDLILKDRELYASFGTIPWYRQLMDRKNKSVLQQIASLIPLLRKFVKDQTVLPTASIVVTTDDFATTQYDFNYILSKRPEYIQKMMKHLMLISFVVYNPINQVVYFFFSGYKHPFIYNVEDLTKITPGSGGGGDVNKSLIAIANKMLTQYN